MWNYSVQKRFKCFTIGNILVKTTKKKKKRLQYNTTWLHKCAQTLCLIHVTWPQMGCVSDLGPHMWQGCDSERRVCVVTFTEALALHRPSASRRSFKPNDAGRQTHTPCCHVDLGDLLSRRGPLTASRAEREKGTFLCPASGCEQLERVLRCPQEWQPDHRDGEGDNVLEVLSRTDKGLGHPFIFLTGFILSAKSNHILSLSVRV